MKANMLIFPLCLLLCWMLSVDAMVVSGTCENQKINSTRRFVIALSGNNINPPHGVQTLVVMVAYEGPEAASKGIPLDMAENSVDDRYLECQEDIMKIIKENYLKKEKQDSDWARIKECAETKLKDNDDKDLTEDHIEAMCLYTSPHVYKDFNKAVRTERSKYSSSFQYHSLHYLLTSAIQILKKKDDSCPTTYRRVGIEFTGEVGNTIRFGSFASSSLRPDLKKYGTETCFEMDTCFGASLNKYSFVYDYEKKKDPDEEVLIPPYEKFEIIKKMNGPVTIKGLEDCKLVFVLKSAGVKNNLNCKVEEKQIHG